MYLGVMCHLVISAVKKTGILSLFVMGGNTGKCFTMHL